MKLYQTQWTAATGWTPALNDPAHAAAQLVLVFGHPDALQNSGVNTGVRAAFPRAQIFGCSTAGEIADIQVADESLVVTAVTFAHTEVLGAQVRLADMRDSFAAGAELARRLPAVHSGPQAGPDAPLRHVLVLSDGIRVNGSDLVTGLSSALPAGVQVTGGLSGDAGRFQQTFTWGQGHPQSGLVIAVGLYGRQIQVGFGSVGGWDAFGPQRLVTRSVGNVLYELDGESALALYKRYLGEHAHQLPASALLFPLSLRTQAEAEPVVRTILNVDEREQSLTFAGNLPEGALVQLMHSSRDRMVDGAIRAATLARPAAAAPVAELAILISCVGRKLLLKQRIEEEVEGVREALGPEPVLAGFYSYGEICPFRSGTRCELHNQTMTITTLAESCL